MRRSAESALTKAKRHIDAAEKTEITEDIINQYQNAKNILARVDTKKEDASSLKDMMDLFLELAIVLDNKKPAIQDKAKKCRQRAAALMQELNKINTISSAITMSLGAATQGAVSLLSKGTATTVTVANNSATSSPTTSTENVCSPASFVSQQKPFSTSQSTIPLSAATDSQRISKLFSKRANRMSFFYGLPAPGEQLETTRQLVYCLALLQDSVDETCLDPADLKWRRSTLKNSNETMRVEAITHQVVMEFIDDCEKNATAVEEVVQLAQVLHEETSRSLLTSLVGTVSRSALLHLHAVEGLTMMIQGATPGSIKSDDLVGILKVLFSRLHAVHSSSASHLCRLLFAVSRVLDAMVIAQVGDVDRIALHGPLTALLHEFESNQNPYVAFQAEYATQALLNVSDNDTIFKAGVRRGWLVLKGVAGFAKMPNPEEIKDALEGLEKLYEAGKGAVRMVKNTWVAIKTSEMPEFTVEEGLKFKRIWYPTLRNAEEYIQTGDLVGFEELVTNAPCRDQLKFQLGICQLLGRFAVDTQWDLESRQTTLVFLKSLCQANDVWVPHKGIEQAIFDMTSILASTHFEAAKAWQREMQQHNLALEPSTSLRLHPWNDILSMRLTDHATPASTLLMAVQNKKRHKESIDAIQSGVEQIVAQRHLSLSSLKDIQSALKTHYELELVIRRVSGIKLNLKTCFVNLAIVESPAQREKEKLNLKEQAAVFHRTPSSEAVEGSNIQSSIPLEQLFDKRKLRDGKENIPKRILVQGRAGIGKTTLCKKLVHEHQNGLWEDRFDAVLWLPLRQLRGSTSRTLESLLRERFFDSQQLDQEHKKLAHTLAVRAEEGKVLFILDGLDEIATDAQGEGNSLIPLLKTLFGQHYVVITSRPSGLNRLLLPEIDLELETIGFSQQNVKDFVVKVLDPGPARTVQDFIQQTPLIQGLVNIPVQLDVVCLCWDSLPMGDSQVTITKLYQLMVRKLWCKDALRLKKTAGDQVLIEEEVNDLSPNEIDELMTVEMHHLGYLAFKGLVNNHQIEFDHQTLLKTFDDLKDYREKLRNGRYYSSQLLGMLKKTSFLHAADADLDPNKKSSQQIWSFLHLTFQEYFAATWIASKMAAIGDDGLSLSAGSMKIEPIVRFVQEHKYNPRFEIVWWMVAGLLKDEALIEYFRLFQDAPRDLIGGRHQQLLASCLNEARDRLDHTVVTRIDAELRRWMNFEIQMQNGKGKNLLGGRASFPEHLLLAELASDCSWRKDLVETLGNRSTLSESAIQSLISALGSENNNIRRSSVTALGKQSTLSESAIQSLITALGDEYDDIRMSAESALGKQSILSEFAIQSLIDALKDKNNNVRRSAALVLDTQLMLSESARHLLIGALKDKNNVVGISAASALGNQSILSESTIQSLIDTLKDKDHYVRRSAALVLCNQSTLSEFAIQSLIGALKDENPNDRWLAKVALGEQSTLSESAIQSLIGIIKDRYTNNRWTRGIALDKNLTLSGSANRSLTEVLKLKNDDVRSLAVSALGNQSILSDSTTQSLIDTLKDEDDDVRRPAVSTLDKQSILSECTIQSLIAALKNENNHIRISAESILDKQSTLSESAIQSLIAALKDENDDVRRSAASILDKQSMLSESAIQPLIDTLKDKSYLIRRLAASAIVKQSSLSESAIQSLIGALKNKNKDVRSSASLALGKQSILSDSAMQSLIDALKDKNDDVRWSIASVLGKKSTLCKSAIQSLIGALKDKNNYVRSSAAAALGNQSILSESAIQSLIDALKDENDDVRRSSALAFSKQSILSESAIQSLIDALKDKNNDIRWLAASALVKQSTLSESAIQSLIDALKDKNTNVRRSAALALGNQSILSESAIQSLIEALKDRDDHVRRSAESTLGKQSTLSVTAIQSLVGTLGDENVFRRSVEMVLDDQLDSLCLALPCLIDHEISCLYKNYLFPYSCRHVISLQVVEDILYFYTDHGLVCSEAIGSDKVKIITLAFNAVQHEARILS
ncbi:MAG: hypothetical protein J3R72DRAFT_390761 [Linnemannia gamsii]|nr:MAG: hypothetical protein J3R72DRAFT_390761 [Linnemannia gamsii]